jgi:hypothetical protein
MAALSCGHFSGEVARAKVVTNSIFKFANVKTSGVKEKGE